MKQISTRNELRVNGMWQWKADILWSKKAKLKCKICRCISNIMHQAEHEGQIKEVIEIFKRKGFEGIVNYKARVRKEKCDDMIQRIDKIREKMRIKKSGEGSYR